MAEHGSVLVVGGGVGGIQASLDLAESGFRAYLVESAPSIGGLMAMLDKTFPTNDCSMCILSPKLVEAGQHPNIEIMSYADLEKVEGGPGDFKVTLRKKARFVNTGTCTGCGACSEVCVMEGRVPDGFNTGLSKRSAIYVPFAQAVPRVALVDPEACLRLTKGKCKSPCVEACLQGSIDFDQKEESATLNVGAVILASGSTPYDISRLVSYHPEHPNVVSSMEIERIMCASGPSAGRMIRPSDGGHAKSIAFIQCAGSRDEKHNPYCSSVCCTYAVKEATVIKEHDPEIDCHIFHIDMRTFGKGFEQFRTRAREEYGIRFTRFKVPAVEVAGPDTLAIRYEAADGTWRCEEYDLVVLSVGLTQPVPVEALVEAGVELDRYGFASCRPATPLDTSKPGVFALGTASGPKDIPETIAQASGAAARCGALLAGARGTEVSKKEYPPEMQLDGAEARVGVFVCSCGKNIGGVVDVPAVTEYAKGLPGVAYAESNTYTCSGESCDRIKEAIRNHDLNRVVVAACTPRTHEPLFRETIREAGLNRYLFDLANIRDQCSWVHAGEPEKATEKARDLVRMSVAKARLLEPLPSLPVKVTPSALVIGGGPAGMSAALELGRAGYSTYLLEKADGLGGAIADAPGGVGDEEYARPLEGIRSMAAELSALDNVEVITGARLVGFSGYIGNFKATIEAGGARELDIGAVIVATGGVEHRPSSYLHGTSERVVTQTELEERLAGGLEAKTVVMVQCVESREPERPYCSRVCCISALNNALAVKGARPDTNVYILYRDIMAYGLYEDLYRAAREAGVLFVRYDAERKPEVSEGDGGLTVKVATPDLPIEVEIDADLLVLSSPVVASEDNREIAEMLKVPVDENGFFLEAHVKLRPVDFATGGIFVAGMAHYPKLVEEAISQGCGAAGRAATILSKEYVMGEGAVAVVDERFCRGCGECEQACEFSAVAVRESEPGRLVAEVNRALCVGCGMCAVACWSNAIEMANFTDEQIEAMIEAVRS